MAGTHVVMTLLAVASVAGATASEADVLARAETAFQEGVRLRDTPHQAKAHFLEAAAHYEELRRRGADNPALDRNMGNAYLLVGELPQAILAYRRGLRLAPDDRGLQAGLAHARSQVAYAPPGGLGQPPRAYRPPWLPRPASEWYLVLALTPYTVGCLAVARWWMTRRGRLLAIASVAFVAAALWLAGLIGEEVRVWQSDRHAVVVITADGVPLREGNGVAYPARYDAPLNRGVEARLLFVRGDWLQIELAGGEVGWVPGASTVSDAD